MKGYVSKRYVSNGVRGIQELRHAKEREGCAKTLLSVTKREGLAENVTKRY